VRNTQWKVFKRLRVNCAVVLGEWCLSVFSHRTYSQHSSLLVCIGKGRCGVVQLINDLLQRHRRLHSHLSPQHSDAGLSSTRRTGARDENTVPDATTRDHA